MSEMAFTRFGGQFQVEKSMVGRLDNSGAGEGRQNPKKLNNYFTIVSNQIDHLTLDLRNLHNNFVSTALHGEF